MHVKDLYNGEFTTLKKEIEGNWKKEMTRPICADDEKNQCCETDDKSSPQTQCNCRQNPSDALHRMGRPP